MAGRRNLAVVAGAVLMAVAAPSSAASKRAGRADFAFTLASPDDCKRNRAHPVTVVVTGALGGGDAGIKYEVELFERDMGRDDRIGSQTLAAKGPEGEATARFEVVPKKVEVNKSLELYAKVRRVIGGNGTGTISNHNDPLKLVCKP